MLRSLNSLKDLNIRATDGPIGHVEEFFFDDQSWEIKYLVARTGNWLVGKKVLIAPPAFGTPNWENQSFPILLSKEEIENSPPIREDRPVSRQAQADLHDFYGWPGYIYDPFPAPLAPVPKETFEEAEKGDPRLRSTREVEGYHIEASDGDIGHVEEFIVDDEEWIIRYVVIDTRNWLPGKKVLIAPEWIENVDWPSGKVQVARDRETIKDSPEFDPSRTVNREYETRLYDYYGRPKYWNR